jgi:phage gp29-like protein
MWQCVWLSMIKSIGWAGWATFVERFGLPTPYVQYGDIAQYTEHKQLFQDLITQLGQGFGAIVPQDVKIDTLQTPNGGRSSDPHSALSDACDAAQSIRVLGATLTAKIGNVGSFAASSTHADVKYAREEADGRRLWASLRSDLLTPLIEFNAESIAKALNAAGYDCTPEMITRRVPRGLHRVPREIDPVQRASVVDMAINKWGLEIGKESLYDEFNLPQSISDDDVAPGEATPVNQGGALVGSVEAANQGADAPPMPQAGAQGQLPEHKPEDDDDPKGGGGPKNPAPGKDMGANLARPKKSHRLHRSRRP